MKNTDSADANGNGVGDVCDPTFGQLLYSGARPTVWAGSSSWFSPVQPARLLDSRPGASTVDGIGAAAGLRAAGSVTELQVAGRGGVPTDAAAVVLNVTVTEAREPGYVTVWPCGSPSA